MRQHANKAAIAIVLVAFVLAIATALSGCNAARLLNLAQAPEDKADALVRVFAEAQESAKNLALNPAISDAEKKRIKIANRVAAPAATALLDASGEYRRVKKQVEELRASGASVDVVILESLDISLSALERLLLSNEKPIRSFQKLVN